MTAYPTLTLRLSQWGRTPETVCCQPWVALRNHGPSRLLYTRSIRPAPECLRVVSRAQQWCPKDCRAAPPASCRSSDIQLARGRIFWLPPRSGPMRPKLAINFLVCTAAKRWRIKARSVRRCKTSMGCGSDPLGAAARRECGKVESSEGG
jgi:hypothetical protein